MKKYSERKAEIRNQAIEWQNEFAEHDYSYTEIAEWQDHFYRLGKRYGLLKEFHENAIC